MLRRVILVRYGEIGLKGLNRPEFERALVRQLERAARAVDPGARVWRAHGRVYVEGGPLEDLVERLRRVFGVVSLSPAFAVPAELDAVRAAVLAAFDEATAAAGPQPRFRISARRADKRFPLTSLELNRELGAHVLVQRPGSRVDLHRPDVDVEVEVRPEGAFVSARTVPGPGGLPVGVSGRALLLLSGGIDSPVAGWMMLKRGVALEAVHFHTPPHTSERSKEKVVQLCRILAGWGEPVPLHVVHFTEVQREIYQRCPPELGVTLMRRFMLRVAERLAATRGALALVTGESVGQVASQTLESMRTIEAVCRLPVLRPLVGMDKAEIVARARAIGTYETSILPYEDCCSLFIPRHPATRPQPEEAEAAERALDVEGLVARSLERVETLLAEAPAGVA